MSFARILISLCLLLAVACPIARADTINLLSGRLWQETDSGSDALELTELPSVSQSIVVGETGYGEANYNMHSTCLGAGLEQSSLASSFFGRSGGEIRFYVEQGTLYRLGTGVNGIGGSMWTAFMQLRNLSTGESLFSSVQFNGAEPLPGVVPDDAPFEPGGEITGLLLPWQKYEFRYMLYSTGETFQEDFEPGMVYGSMNATFGPDVVAVPLPPAWAAGALLLAVLAGAKRLGALRRWCH